MGKVIFGDLCAECSNKIWSVDFNDFSDLCKIGEIIEVTCASCGRINVNHLGERVSSVENYNVKPTHYFLFPYDAENLSGIKRFKNHFNRLPYDYEAILFDEKGLDDTKTLTFCRNWETDFDEIKKDYFLATVKSSKCKVIYL